MQYYGTCSFVKSNLTLVEVSELQPNMTGHTLLSDQQKVVSRPPGSNQNHCTNISAFPNIEYHLPILIHITLSPDAYQLHTPTLMLFSQD